MKIKTKQKRHKKEKIFICKFCHRQFNSKCSTATFCGNACRIDDKIYEDHIKRTIEKRDELIIILERKWTTRKRQRLERTLVGVSDRLEYIEMDIKQKRKTNEKINEFENDKKKD